MRKINNDGVTLMSLVITIIVLLLLASIATYSGVNIVKQSKFTKFTTQLKMMQTQVNELYEKYSGNQSIEINGKKYTGTEIANIGKEISTLSQKNKVFNASTSGITDSTGYKYYDKEIIKALNIDGLEEEEYFVNVAKRSVISYDGFEYNGKTYYTLEQLPDGLYNVEYSENTGKPTFDVNYECIEGGKYKMTISNIIYNGNIDKWQIRYQKEGQDYWSTSEDYNFVVNESGKYKIYIQNNNVVSEEKNVNLEKIGSTGSIISLKTTKGTTEEFYILSYDKDTKKAKALAKYNLMVGEIYDSNGKKIEDVDKNATNYGLQEETMRGWVEGKERRGTVVFSSSKYWIDTTKYPSQTAEHSSIYPWVYNKNEADCTISKYVELYKTLLGNTDKVNEVSLASYEDINALWSDRLKYNWLYSTSYWLGSAGVSTITNFWRVSTDGTFEFSPFNSSNTRGVRPVITIDMSKI